MKKLLLFTVFLFSAASLKAGGFIFSPTNIVSNTITVSTLTVSNTATVSSMTANELITSSLTVTRRIIASSATFSQTVVITTLTVTNVSSMTVVASTVTFRHGMMVGGNIESSGTVRILNTLTNNGLIPATSTGAGTGYPFAWGTSLPVRLVGSVAAVEGSVIIATTPASPGIVAGFVSHAVADQTGWIGVAREAAAVDTTVHVFIDGFAYALTTGTVNPGDTLVTSILSPGYLISDVTPTAGADVGVAQGSGNANGGLTRIRLR